MCISRLWLWLWLHSIGLRCKPSPSVGETRPGKEISCRFMCSIKLLRQSTSLAFHSLLVSWRIWSKPCARAPFLELENVGTETVCSAMKFHGSNALKDSTPGVESESLLGRGSVFKGPQGAVASLMYGFFCSCRTDN